MDTIKKYNRAATLWDQQIAGMGYIVAYEEFLSAHACASGDVLDVGTGTGAFARAWIKSGGSAKLCLLDSAQEMLRVASRKLADLGVTPKTIHADIAEYATNQQFKTILAAHVIEHCQSPSKTLSKLSDRLTDDGILILVVSKPHWCNWLIWLRYRHNWFSAQEVRRLANDAGLTSKYIHKFTSGPPSRTSLGYIFAKQKGKFKCSSLT